jgi:cold shock CspA family protein
MSKRLGVVMWFDNSAGEGMIFDPKTNESLFVHWSAIEAENLEIVKTLKALTKYSPVEFTVYQNIYMKQVDSVWPLHFNYSIENEHKLNRLMNRLFEIGSEYIFDLAEIYFKEIA